MGDDVYVLDSVVGHQQTVLDLPIWGLVLDPLQQTLNENPVFGMSAPEHKVYGRRNRSVILEDAEGFVRPAYAAACHVPSKTSRLAQFLRFGEIGLAAA